MTPRLTMLERLYLPGGFELMTRMVGEAAHQYGLGGSTIDISESDMVKIATDVDLCTIELLKGNETFEELWKVLNAAILAALEDYFKTPNRKAAITGVN